MDIHLLATGPAPEPACDESGEVIVARPDPQGVFHLSGQGHVLLPAQLRRRCGLRTGDRVLLAADPVRGTLIVRSPAALDNLVTAPLAASTSPDPATAAGGSAVTPTDNPPVESTAATPARQAELDAARLLLARMGITPTDLTTAPTPTKPVPTFAAYIPLVAALVTPGTARVYDTYWSKIMDAWGERRLDEPTPSEIKQLMAGVRATMVIRRNTRGAADHMQHLGIPRPGSRLTRLSGSDAADGGFSRLRSPINDSPRPQNRR